MTNRPPRRPTRRQRHPETPTPAATPEVVAPPPRPEVAPPAPVAEVEAPALPVPMAPPRSPGVPAAVERLRDALVPATLRDALELADRLAASAFAPRDFRNKPGDVFAAIQFGAELGLLPLQALQSIAVVNGRPALYGDGALAVVESSGLLADIEETFTGSGDDYAAVCRVRRVGRAWHERRFSVADAKIARLWGKEGPWRTNPGRMLQMRARAFALRDRFADVLRGFGIREELLDIEPLEAGGGAGGIRMPAARPEAGPAPAVDTGPPAAPVAALPVPEAPEAPDEPREAPAEAEAPEADAVIDEHERRRLVAVCKEHGVTFAALKQHLVARGVPSSTRLPRAMLSAVLDWAAAGGPEDAPEDADAAAPEDGDA